MSEDRAMGGLVQLIGAKYVGDETSWCTSVEVTAGPAARQIGDALSLPDSYQPRHADDSARDAATRAVWSHRL
jgi:hypothetical protein